MQSLLDSAERKQSKKPVVVLTQAGEFYGEHSLRSLVGYYGKVIRFVPPGRADASKQESDESGCGVCSLSPEEHLYLRFFPEEVVYLVDELHVVEVIRMLVPLTLSSLRSILESLPGSELMYSSVTTAELVAMQKARGTRFVERYLAYRFLVKQGWIVQCGLQFGCDFTLYMDHPTRVHSSYLAQVCHADTGTGLGGADPEVAGAAKTTWKEIAVSTRLASQVNKSFLQITVSFDSHAEFDVSKLTARVDSVLVKRWIPQDTRQ